MKRITLANAFQSCTLLINPHRYPQFVKILKKITSRTSITNIIESTDKEDFMKCMDRFFQGPDKNLLVWGGDGTAHLALNSYMSATKKYKQATEKRIGFLRGGSGNGIQDSYEVPLTIKNQLKAFAESIQQGYVEKVDILKVEFGSNTIYCQLLGFGFDAQVLKKRETRIARWGKNKGHPKPGIINYAISGTHTFLFNYQKVNQQYRVLLHNGRYAYHGYRVNAQFPFSLLERDASIPLLEIGTRPYYGKLFKICPDVVCNNGIMDVYFYIFPDKWSILRNVHHIWQGNHSKINKHLTKRNQPVIERYEVKKTKIESPQELVFHADGELHTHQPVNNGNAEITISVLPQKIPFLVPGTFYRKFHPFTSGVIS